MAEVRGQDWEHKNCQSLGNSNEYDEFHWDSLGIRYINASYHLNEAQDKQGRLEMFLINP